MYAHIQRHTRWASALLHNSSYAEGRGWLVRLILCIHTYIQRHTRWVSVHNNNNPIIFMTEIHACTSMDICI